MEEQCELAVQRDKLENEGTYGDDGKETGRHCSEVLCGGVE